VTCKGVVPVRGETLSQFAAVLVEAETLTGTGSPLLTIVSVDGAGLGIPKSTKLQQSCAVYEIVGTLVAVSPTLIVVGTTGTPLSAAGAMGVTVTVPEYAPADSFGGSGVRVSVLDEPFFDAATESHCPPVVETLVVKSKLPVSVTFAGAGAGVPTSQDQEADDGETGSVI
jgi:hypothetical protein